MIPVSTSVISARISVLCDELWDGTRKKKKKKADKTVELQCDKIEKSRDTTVLGVKE